MAVLQSPVTSEIDTQINAKLNTPTNQERRENNPDTQFLNEHQYQINGILRYEFIFGEGFISTGGYTTTRQIFDNYLPELKTMSTPKILDVGCGIGGGPNYILTNVNNSAIITGIDLSTNCIEIAKKKYPNIQFKVTDALLDNDILLSNKYDLIYSRDCIIHIGDKESLFQRFAQSLSPNGYVLITDYTVGEDYSKFSTPFKQYLKDRSYDLRSFKEYSSVLENSGLEIVCAKDNREWFDQILQDELEKIQVKKDEFLEKFTMADLNDLKEGWEDKRVWVSAGFMSWSLFICKLK